MPTDELTKDIEQQAHPGVIYSRQVPMTANARFVSFSGLYGDNYDRHANPDSIPFETYNQIRMHSIVRAALILIKSPILSCIQRATVECEDPRIKKFIEHNFLDNGLLYRLSVIALRALDFGVAATEKLWDVDDQHLTYTVQDDGEQYDDVAWSGPALIIKDFIEVNPMTILFIKRDLKTRAFAGFVQSFAPTWMYSGVPQQQPLPPPPKDKDDALMGALGITIDAQKAFLYTHEIEYGNLWGVPRTKPAYPSYFWCQVALKYYMAWAERKLVPTRVVRHPIGRDQDGTDYADLAIQIASAIDDVQAVAVPNSMVREAGTQPGGGYAWTFEEVQTTDKSETWQNLISMLNTDMLRAMFVPERTFTSGQGFGLFSTDAQAHTDTFLMTEDAEAGDLINAINKDAVRPSVVANFGSDAPDCNIRVPGITDAHKEMLREIITQLLTSPGVPDIVDVKRILDELGVPVKDVDLESPQPEAEPTEPVLPEAAPEQQPGAEQPEETGQPASGTPGNVALEDIQLDFDANRWEVDADPKAILGYRVTDKQTGKRLTGFAAYQVIQSYEKQGKSEAKKAAAAAVREQKHQASEAKKAANQQVAAQKKAQREALAAQHKAQRQAEQQQRKAEAAARKAAAEARRAQAKAERLATSAAKKAAHDALVNQHKAELAAKQAAHKAEMAQKAAAREQAKQQREADRQQKQQEKTSAAAQSAKVATVKAEKSALEKTTSGQDVATAAQTLKQSGYSVLSSTGDINQAVTQATAAARSDPNSVYTVVRARGGYMVAGKRASAIDTTPGPSNVSLADDGAYGAGRLPESLLDEAAKKLGKHLRKGA